MSPYLLATAGGALIGAAAVVLMATVGRIAGISGIVGGLLAPTAWRDNAWRAAFVFGLVAAPLVVAAVTGRLAIGDPAAARPVLIAAGLLVGIGTALGSGCTSGHGICGLARLSPRSAAAVATFMVVGAVTVFVVRHV